MDSIKKIKSFLNDVFSKDKKDSINPELPNEKTPFAKPDAYKNINT